MDCFFGRGKSRKRGNQAQGFCLFGGFFGNFFDCTLDLSFISESINSRSINSRSIKKSASPLQKNAQTRVTSATALFPKELFYPLVAMFLFACGSAEQTSKSTQPPQFVDAPQITNYQNNANSTAQILSFSVDAHVRAKYQIGDLWSHENTQYQQTHSQPLPPLSVNQLIQGVEVRVSIEDRQGNEATHTQIFSVPAASINQDQQPIVVWDKGFSRPAYTLLSFYRYQSALTPEGDAFILQDDNFGLLQAFDQSGAVVWQYQASAPIEQITRAGPYSLTVVNRNGLTEIDLLGNAISWLGGQRQKAPWAGDAIDDQPNIRIGEVDRVHSQSVKLPGGGRLVLASRLRERTRTPTVAANPYAIAGLNEVLSLKVATTQRTSIGVTQLASGDLVLELNAKGDVVKRWDLFELLASQRTTYYSHLPDARYTNYISSYEYLPTAWARASGLSYNPDTQTIAVAMAHQDTVVGLDRQSGGVKWLLADPQGWSPAMLTKVLGPTPNKSEQYKLVPYLVNACGYRQGVCGKRLTNSM